MNLDNRLGYLLSKEFRDMTPEEQAEYKQHKMWVITNYLGVPSLSESSLRLRTQAFLEETKQSRPSIWD